MVLCVGEKIFVQAVHAEHAVAGLKAAASVASAACAASRAMWVTGQASALLQTDWGNQFLPPCKRWMLRFGELLGGRTCTESVKGSEQKLWFRHRSGKLEEEDEECGGRTLQSCSIHPAHNECAQNAEQEKATE